MLSNERQRICDVAQNEVGYVEKPTNRTKYGQEFGFDEVPWCQIFIWWVYRAAGQALPKTASTRQLWAWAQQRAHGLSVVHDPQPGDLVYFDMPGGYSPTDHVEIVLSVHPTHLRTVGGNTSSGESGSQTNGGMVAQRTRPYTYVRGYVAAALKLGAPAPIPNVPQEDDDVQLIHPYETPKDKDNIYLRVGAALRRLTPDEFYDFTRKNPDSTQGRPGFGLDVDPIANKGWLVLKALCGAP